jgi:tetratricopeptide (TPR) repeat protein
MPSRSEAEVKAAFAAIDAEDASLGEKVEMLMEMAMGLQTRPKTPEHLQQAILLYEKALEICPADQFLLRGRLHARLATALQAVPANDLVPLKAAQAHLEAARGILKLDGTPEEIAEIEMNLGLVLQSLAGAHAVPITEAISAYQRALRTFNATAFPKEYAILQNNLATAFLSIPFSDERSKMREALAVQAFQEGLKIVTLIDHPSEYAMLQNNLGNALQYVSSGHSVENSLRALDAYDEALKVRTRATTPAEYANTIANYANCLRNLPDNLEKPENGNQKNLARALNQYREAIEIFSSFGETQKVEAVREMIVEIEAELTQSGGHSFDAVEAAAAISLQ